MTNTFFNLALLEHYHPQLPVAQLVIEVNRIYHSFEAESYDTSHPEIYKQLPAIWQEMIETLVQRRQSTTWHILDFGCGTGFEAEQLLRHLPHDNIVKMTCYDPSPEMLERCRTKIASVFPKAVFCNDLEELSASGDTFNLLATNSLLHHLPDPYTVINNWLPLLDTDAVWLAGHEPSNRFYRNPACMKLYESFNREHKWRKFLFLPNYLKKLQLVFGVKVNPAKKTAEEAFHRGLFRREPTEHIIMRLVDFHVAHGREEVSLGRGFDFELMQVALGDCWKLVWVKTYAYMGSFYEDEIPAKWVRLSHQLAHAFPKDGANFCALWKRV